MEAKAGTKQAATATSKPLNRRGPASAPSRRLLLPAARRALWNLLRARAHWRGLRPALRDRLRTFLAAAGQGRLLRLLREASFAAAVAAALLGTTSPCSGQAIELADVAAGQGGVAVHGNGGLPSHIGSSVANAGDVDGDGIPDAIIGNLKCQYYCDSDAIYVVFGRTDRTPAEIEDIAAGRGGFVIRGNNERERLGWSISGAGDVNGDRLEDLLIGAPRADPGGKFDAGASYVVFGKRTTEAVELSEIAAGRGGFVIRGESERDESGSSVSGAGDVNGDRLEDLLIGASYGNSSYVVFGKRTTEAVELSEIAAGQGGFVIRGESTGNFLGSSVSGAGDINGDGVADLLIGSPGADASYVVFGRGTTDEVDLSDVAGGRGGFVIRGEGESVSSGLSVSGAGDVNGDGLGDLLIGAPRASSRGATYVVFGKATTEVIDLSDVAAGTGGFVIHGESERDQSGWSVSGAGDVNGDGLADLLIGAPGSDPGGASYIVFGKATTEAVELTEITKGRGGHAITGFGLRNYSLLEVSGAGDVNGDGLQDLLIGAPQASYVVFGKRTSEGVEFPEIAAGRGGFVIRGESTGDLSGSSVSGAGDINGDGLADLLIGAPGAGASYVVFGRGTTDAVHLSDVAGGRGGFVIRGEGESVSSGLSVSGAGDVNGDGLPDLLIGGAQFAYPGSRNRTGTSYVVFGKRTTEVVELSDVAAGQGGFVIRGEIKPDERYHLIVSGAGDVNGDELSDLLIGAPFADPGVESGSSYVVFGKRTTEAVELSQVKMGQGGFVIRGESTGDRSGSSVSGAGDVNGDGLSDLLVGAPSDYPGGRDLAGASYVVFGKATIEAVELSEIAAGRGGFVIRGESASDQSGSSVSSAGDINGDRLGDLLIGALGAVRGYVVLGKKTTEAIELSDVAAGRGGFVVRGESTGGASGFSVSGTGDVNADGIPDLAIGIGGEGFIPNNPNLNGTAYLVFGPPRAGVPRFRRGEANGDLEVDLSDAIATLGWLFLGGRAPGCLDGADTNDDGEIDISDGVATLGYLFLGDKTPPIPGPRNCGIDPTSDPLGCESPPEDCR